MESDHRKWLTFLDDLMKPISTVKISNQDEQLTINLVFSNACSQFVEVSNGIDIGISSDSEQPPYWRYLQIHLNLLAKVATCEHHHLSPELPLFSVQDETILSRSLATVILLGLVLHFDEGIYLSMDKYLKSSASSLHLTTLKTNLTHHDRMYRLRETLDCIMGWMTVADNKSNSSFFTQRLCSHHLLELITGHLQLLYSPNLKYCSEQFSQSSIQEKLDWLRTRFPSAFIQEIMQLNRLLSTTVNSPVWLKQRCGELLTSILIDKNNLGVRRILQTILETASSTEEWRLHGHVAQIITSCPKQLSPDEYLTRIGPQIIDLFHDKRYVRVSCVIIDQLLKKYPTFVEQRMFPVLLAPLIACRECSSDVICPGDRFEIFVNDLYNLTTLTTNQQIRMYLQKYFLVELIDIFMALEQSLSPLKSNFLPILAAIFSPLDSEASARRFQDRLLAPHTSHFKFIPDTSSTFSLITDSDIHIDILKFCQLMEKLLFTIDNNDRLIVRLFLDLLQSSITTSTPPITTSFLISQSETEANSQQIKRMFFLKRLIEHLTEHIDLLIENVDDTIRVLKILLETITNPLKGKPTRSILTIASEEEDEDEDLPSDSEALQMIFAIGTLLITHYDQLSHENRQVLASLYPSLKLIEQHHPNDELRQLAGELAAAFVTFGAVVETSHSSKASSLIEEIADDERDLRLETFGNAWTSLYDPNIPIRAHGLILFRRLIERHDQETLSKIDDGQVQLLTRFQYHLHAQDSYEYLAAINVLCALADRCTDKVLPVLCGEYIGSENVERKLEDRLKVGEILVKTCRSLGDMASKYSPLLINTFLNASKQSIDGLYRASALSNLGQLCTVLKYSLSRHIQEILIALKSYLSPNEPSEVRRAAILVIELLCQSLERSTWLNIVGSELASFYRVIVHLYKNDKDEIVRLHAQLALDALNNICRDFLQPSVVLEKEIRVLSNH